MISLDNDVIVKLASCGLWELFLGFLPKREEQVFTLFTMKYVVQTKMKENEYISIEQSLKKTQTVNNSGTDDLLQEIQRLSINNKNINEGESILMTEAYKHSMEGDSCFLTGDKNFLQAFLSIKGNSSKLEEMFLALKQNTLCLEFILLALIKKYGFDCINKKIIDSGNMKCDGVIELAFGQDRNEEHAKDCLWSFCRDIATEFEMDKHKWIK